MPVHPSNLVTFLCFLMEKEKSEKNCEMGSDSSDKTPNGDSNMADDSSIATNEDLEGKKLKNKKNLNFLKKFLFRI